jgi:hypothetical protein
MRSLQTGGCALSSKIGTVRSIYCCEDGTAAGRMAALMMSGQRGQGEDSKAASQWTKRAKGEVSDGCVVESEGAVGGFSW